MEPVIMQIVAGTCVALVSFSFGYLLFRLQRAEETKLEVFRRRLNSYEKIVDFLEDLDTFSHRGHTEVPEKRQQFVWRLFKLRGSVGLYLSKKVHELLGILVDTISFLPGSLADLENVYEELFDEIEKEAGTHLPNWRVEWIKKRKSKTGEKL